MKAYRAALLRFADDRSALYEEDGLLVVGPDATGLGWVYQYYLHVDPEKGIITFADGRAVLDCEPIPPFLMAMLRDGGLLPHLERRMKEKTT